GCEYITCCPSAVTMPICGRGNQFPSGCCWNSCKTVKGAIGRRNGTITSAACPSSSSSEHHHKSPYSGGGLKLLGSNRTLKVAGVPVAICTPVSPALVY